MVLGIRVCQKFFLFYMNSYKLMFTCVLGTLWLRDEGTPLKWYLKLEHAAKKFIYLHRYKFKFTCRLCTIWLGD